MPGVEIQVAQPPIGLVRVLGFGRTSDDRSEMRLGLERVLMEGDVDRAAIEVLSLGICKGLSQLGPFLGVV